MKPNRKQHCFEDIRTGILTMEIAPGADLDETALSEAYGMSRTPFREVLQRLAGEGYLQLSENRGAKVASMDLAVMRSFFQTAPLIYSSIARLAAENSTTEQLDALKEIQRNFSAAVEADRSEDMALHNHRFHEQIGHMAANDYLTASLNRLLMDHTRLGQTFYRPASDQERGAVTKACQQHDAMIAAFEARDSAVATDLTLQHWELSRDWLERFVRPDPLPIDVVDFSEKRHAV